MAQTKLLLMKMVVGVVLKLELELVHRVYKVHRVLKADRVLMEPKVLLVLKVHRDRKVQEDLRAYRVQIQLVLQV